MTEALRTFNQKIIDEFRANQGVVGEPFAGTPLMLLGTLGAKSGERRINPLAYIVDGEDLIIAASFAGADQHPPWYFNLVADPKVSVEVGADTYEAEAIVVDEPERTRLYTAMETQMSTFTSYREKTQRPIPVIRLRKIV